MSENEVKTALRAVQVTGPAHYQRAFERLGVGEFEGTLVPEPDNEYDPNAIRVDVNGTKIGYVPAYIASRIVTYINQPTKVELTINDPTGRQKHRHARIVDVR